MRAPAAQRTIPRPPQKYAIELSFLTFFTSLFFGFLVTSLLLAFARGFVVFTGDFAVVFAGVFVVDLLDFLVIVFAIMFILLILMFILARPRTKVKFKT